MISTAHHDYRSTGLIVTLLSHGGTVSSVNLLPPGDLDVLVLGDPERAGVYDAANHAERRVGIDANPTIRSVEEWASGDQLLAELRSRSLEVLVVDASVDQLADLPSSQRSVLSIGPEGDSDGGLFPLG